MNSNGCSASCDPSSTGVCDHALADAEEWRAERAREARYASEDYYAGDDEYERDDGDSYDVPERWEL